jgi:hypothetical protein
VVERQVTEAMRYILPAATSEGTYRQRMRTTIDALLRFAEEQPGAWQILFRHLDDDDPEIAEIRASIYETTITLGSILLPEEASLLGIDPMSTRGRVMAETVVGSIVAVVRWWHRQPDVPREEVLDALAEITWKGAGGVAATGRRRQRTRSAE